MLQKMQYQPGVVKDDTAYSAQSYATDSANIRWRLGRAESLGGYEDAALGQRMQGVARGMHAWVDNVGFKYCAAGTNSKLYVEQEGTIYDITPLESEFPGTGNAARATAIGTITITQSNHFRSVGDAIYINVLATSSVWFDPTKIYDNNSFYTGEGSSIVTTQQIAAHGLVNGDIVVIADATPVNGLDINGTWTIAVLDAFTWTIDAGALASGSGFDGGAAVSVSGFRQYIVSEILTVNTFTVASNIGGVIASTFIQTFNDLKIGRIDGRGVNGYSIDGYGSGPFGYRPDPKNRAEYLPRTWALAHLGQFLVANPLGGGVYMWQLGLSTRATLVPAAPLQNDYMIVTEEGAIMVFGTIDTDGNYDPMAIRNSDIRSGVGTFYEEWTPTLANNSGEVRLEVGSQIIGARVTKNGIAVLTDVSFHFGSFTGATASDPYLFQHIGSGCGAAGPNAIVEKDGTVYWFNTSSGVFVYTSGTPTQMPCPIRQYVVDAIPALQSFKIYGAYDVVFNGLIFLYPGESDEVDRYFRVDLQEITDAKAGWSIGPTNMTAWLDRNPLTYPRSVDINGMLADQEKGLSANGAEIERYVEYAPLEIEGVGQHIMNINKCIFDCKIEGDIQLTINFQRYPSGPSTVKGPFSMQDGTTSLSTRGQGRQASIKWSSFGIADKWRMGDIRFDVSQGGLR